MNMKAKNTILPVIQMQKLFAEIAKSITSTLDISKIIAAIMKQVELFYRPNNWSLLRVDPETCELYFVVAKGINEDAAKSLRLKFGEGVAGHVAKTGKSMLIKDVKNSSHFCKKIDELFNFKTKSVIAVPIVYKKHTLGVIELVNAIKKGSFSKYDLTILEIIADFSAIAIANSLAYERMKVLAKSDPLTGLYNRAQLDKLLITYAQPSKAKRKIDKSYILVVTIDINNFKQVNDLYGHSVGDSVLYKAAKLLRSCCRDYDFAFRIGGDEFLLVVTNLEKSSIPAAISRMNHQLSHFTNEIAPAPGFSFGIASGKKSQLNKLIQQSDKLMYQYKQEIKMKQPSFS